MLWKFNPFTKKLDIADSTVGPPGTLTGLEGDTGGFVGPDGSGKINILGADGGNVSGDPGTNTLTINGIFGWTTTVSASFTPLNAAGYLCQSDINQDVNLPVSSVIIPAEDRYYFKLVMSGIGTFTVNLNDGDSLQFGNQTLISPDTLVSSSIGDSIEIVCESSNVSGNQWIAFNAQGNITIT